MPQQFMIQFLIDDEDISRTGCIYVDQCASGLMNTMYEKDEMRSLMEEESLQAFAE